MLTAIIGSHLLRRMASHHAVKHAMIAEGMLESALQLEKLAIKVRVRSRQNLLLAKQQSASCSKGAPTALFRPPARLPLALTHSP